jgi:hypothetical protein
VTVPSAGIHEFAQGQVIRVPAPVLIDAEQHALALGGGDQRLGLFRVGGERFVADHRDAVFDGFQYQGRTALRVVEITRASTPASTIWPMESKALRPGWSFASCWRRSGAGHHTDKRRAGQRRNQRRMKEAPSVAVADQSNSHDSLLL